jgi:hypothetical protein
MPLDDIAVDEVQEVERQLAQRRQQRALRRRARVARFGMVKEAIASSWAFILRDGAGIIGIATLSYGAWLAWHPAGFIAGGALLVAGAWISGSRE